MTGKPQINAACFFNLGIIPAKTEQNTVKERQAQYLLGGNKMKGKITIIASVCIIAALTVGILAVGAKSTGGAPIAENLEITTYRDVSVNGQLKATDPDGDILSFEITTKPKKGEIVLGENGSFVYTPAEGKRGSDYFGYKAKDSDGRESSEATVIIKIVKQKCAINYSDLDKNGVEYSALVLAEKGIFTGENLGGQYVFNPEAPVTRGEFLTMCMKVADCDILSGVITTGFEDDGSIPGYQKPYVSTALLTGIINGYRNGYKTAVFNSENNITHAEAAVMLNKALQLTNVKSTAQVGTAPVWAMQACANLSACDISEYGSGSYEAGLTRADCAKLLMGAMQVLENR
jgi:hypothetical protein